MIKKILSLLLMSLAGLIPVIAQDDYSEGYIIDNDGKKITCHIDLNDRKNNPEGIKYYIDRTNILSALPGQIKAFGTGTGTKYISFEGEIDMSDNGLDRMTSSRQPEWKKVNIFLKVLIEGSGSLYSHSQKGMDTKFFFSSSDVEIKQLVYKKFKGADGNTLENNAYRNQLYTYLRIPGVSPQALSEINYRELSLFDYIAEYNSSLGKVYTAYNTVNARAKTWKRVFAGASFNSFSTTDIQNEYTLDFGNGLSLITGFELEYNFPYAGNKLSILFQPALKMAKAQATDAFLIAGEETTYDFKLKYMSMDLPLGMRFYALNNKVHKLYADISFAFNLSIGSTIIRSDGQEYELRSPIFSPRFGIGYGYGNISMGVLIDHNRDIMHLYNALESSFNQYSLVMKYQF